MEMPKWNPKCWDECVVHITATVSCLRSKTGFVPAPKPALCRPWTCCTKTGFVPTLNLPHQNRLCIGTEPAFSFWINISTVSELRCDCQGLGLVARIEASILVFDTKQVLYWPVLGHIQLCSFDRRCKTCLDTKPVLYQGRFCSLTAVISQTTFLNTFSFKKVCIVIQISLKFGSWGPIDHKLALVHVMAWCWTSDKLLPEPMLT